MSADMLPPLLVIVPLLAAAASLVLGTFHRTQRIISVAAITTVLMIGALLLVLVDSGGSIVVEVGGWPPPWGIVLVVDRLSAIMVTVTALVLLAVLLFAIGQGSADDHRDTPVSIFYPTYLILGAGLFVAFIAGDLFNMYVGFEILLAASYVLLTLGGTGARIRAGVTYIVMSLVSSLFFVASIALLYGATGTVNIAQLSVRISELDPGVQVLLHVMLLLGFGIKAAVFPLSFWLPDSYPTAPAPVTAVFAGLLTKVGVYAILRTETVLFPDSTLNPVLMVLAGLTLIVGILGAVAQADIKRLLSYTLVSHIGYMLFGVAMESEVGMTATIYYVVHHILVQTALFLAVGLVERVGGTTSISRLGGLAERAPLLGVLFLIPALNLSGIPPFSGFLGKVGLFEAGAIDGSPLAWAVVGAGAVTSLLTLYALLRVWNVAFWRSDAELERGASPLVAELQQDPDDDGTVRTRTTTPLMVGATTGLVLATVALTVFAGPLFELAGRAATALTTPTQYVQAVFPDGVP